VQRSAGRGVGARIDRQRLRTRTQKKQKKITKGNQDSMPSAQNLIKRPSSDGRSSSWSSTAKSAPLTKPTQESVGRAKGRIRAGSPPRGSPAPGSTRRGVVKSWFLSSSFLRSFSEGRRRHRNLSLWVTPSSPPFLSPHVPRPFPFPPTQVRVSPGPSRGPWSSASREFCCWYNAVGG